MANMHSDATQVTNLLESPSSRQRTSKLLTKRNPVFAIFATIAVISAMAVLPAMAANVSTVRTSTGVQTHGDTKITPYKIGWLLTCKYSHSSNDDPIVHPDMAGMSHRHDFFGNNSTNASSTFASMEKSSTSCGSAADTASYWAPSLKVRSGGGLKVVAPFTSELYYRSRYPKGTVVETVPPDLRMISGSALATSTQSNPGLVGNHIHWECNGDASRHYLSPPTNCSKGTVVESIAFPSCWDGVLTHTNDTVHLTYVAENTPCPSGFPHALPLISIRIKYVVGKSVTEYLLSSGGTYTAHADFWNTWQPKGLMYLVTKCINARIDCGTNPKAPMG